MVWGEPALVSTLHYIRVDGSWWQDIKMLVTWFQSKFSRYNEVKYERI